MIKSVGPTALALILLCLVLQAVAPADARTAHAEEGAPPEGAGMALLAASKPGSELAARSVDIPMAFGATFIAAGWQHTCAVTGSGGLKCWGGNAFGQIGDGTTVNRSTPVDVSGLSGVSTVAPGAYHTCAVTGGGGAKCWGGNSSGQLGNNSTFPRATPVDVSGLTSGVTAIAVGEGHSCALTNLGGVKCWGDNNAGELGDGTTIQRLAPVDVSGLGSGVTAIAAGFASTCALLSGGTVKCWGDNSAGQLGDGTTLQRNAPVDVSGLTGVKAIAVGLSHACALTNGGGVKCWGMNLNGQIGDGTTTERPTPVDVSGLSGASAIAAGRYHSCAVTSGGGVACWGTNTDGQLGDGSTPGHPTPGNVSGLASGVSAITAGFASEHTCALTTTGAVECWGRNAAGQIGDGTTTSRPAPVGVDGLTKGVISVAAGGGFTCAVLSDGTVKCWGYNEFGQLGDGTTLNSKATPVYVLAAPAGPPLSGARAVAAGAEHACALMNSGGVKCWGHNNEGQLGDGSTIDRSTAADVSGLANVIAIATGGFHTCALLNDGTTKCWGSDSSGQLGDGDNTYTSKSVPATVLGLSDATAIAAGMFHTCKLRSGGGVECWGENDTGQLGDDTTTTSNTLVEVLASPGGPPLTGVSAIGAGQYHTCALMNGGGVKCWGYNAFGQLGDGTPNDRHTPVAVYGMTSGSSGIAPGGEHTCAVRDSGGAMCWGVDDYGQLGDGTTNVSYTPVDVSGLSVIHALAAGYQHTCALTSGGAVKCWGRGDNGELGNGSKTDSSTWVSVSGLIPTSLTKVTLNVSPAVVGQSVTFTANVSGELGTPTGAVQFQVDGTNLGAPVSLSGGSATSPAAAWAAVGEYLITATYRGDSNFTGSRSGTVVQRVNPASTTVAITNAAALAAPSLVNHGYAVNYAVTANSPGGGTPTGTVTVSDGTDTCSANVAAGTCNLTSTTVGAKTLTATYSGDTNDAASGPSAGVAHSVVTRLSLFLPAVER